MFSKTKQYEYQVLQSNSLVNEKQLNELAREGWRLVTIVPVEYTFYFYFEREIS